MVTKQRKVFIQAPFKKPMQIKLLTEIISHVTGKPGAGIVEILMGKKKVNEFLIANKLKLTINQTRNILYKLSDSGLVSFIRKKDRKKGWYTYYWTLDSLKALELLENNVKREIESLKNQLKAREARRYYVCNTCKVEVSEETALLHNFTCGECGEVFQLQTDRKAVTEIISKMNKFSNSLIIIQQELAALREKEAKKKEKAEKGVKKAKAKPAKKLKKKKTEKKKIKKAKKKRR